MNFIMRSTYGWSYEDWKDNYREFPSSSRVNFLSRLRAQSDSCVAKVTLLGCCANQSNTRDLIGDRWARLVYCFHFIFSRMPREWCPSYHIAQYLSFALAVIWWFRVWTSNGRNSRSTRVGFAGFSKNRTRDNGAWCVRVGTYPSRYVSCNKPAIRGELVSCLLVSSRVAWWGI